MDTAERAGATSARILRKKAADYCPPPGRGSMRPGSSSPCLSEALSPGQG